MSCPSLYLEVGKAQAIQLQGGREATEWAHLNFRQAFTDSATLLAHLPPCRVYPTHTLPRPFRRSSAHGPRKVRKDSGGSNPAVNKIQMEMLPPDIQYIDWASTYSASVLKVPSLFILFRLVLLGSSKLPTAD